MTKEELKEKVMSRVVDEMAASILSSLPDCEWEGCNSKIWVGVSEKFCWGHYSTGPSILELG
jgi:hypothetical protein